mmetsp:Transcript_37681/g.52343  ORF Transcript_37681/g.52343 Transcript_37681/m.52343 type:complete len:139 (+) Transcript_37681:190-606(+)|eukprot:CAMPEP_0196592718 /NCGR_PEP_ID=MMETSP1081-20130531/73593_1 /TAXON_ID=36882 /ORGANISM="Pyramimonas amylifera, Strain CCMP720" /LENGTH=138 /DNA_ID=CAMNT_0041916489 /DNA_START=206 /DNA_END=622 /DNA_ORIENTATION=+
MGKAPHAAHKGTKTKKGHKSAKRATFIERGIDHLWEDVRSEVPVHDSESGPQGNMGRRAHDEDVAGFGKFYCIPCGRYFQTAVALSTHHKTKMHKKRVKELKGARPHTQQDAEAAVGMGSVDNGQPLQSENTPEGMSF